MASTYVEAFQLAAFSNPAMRSVGTNYSSREDQIRDAGLVGHLQHSKLEAKIETAVFGEAVQQSISRTFIKSNDQTPQSESGNDNTPNNQVESATAINPFEFLRPVHTRPSVILVHAAWQTCSSLQHLAFYLRSYGHKVLTPALPSTTTRPAVQNWDCDVSAVRTCTMREIEGGRNVVLVMNSYGAAVGCEALRDIPAKQAGEKKAGVVKLGFIAGWIPKQGDCLWGEDRKERWRPGMVLTEDLIVVYDGANRFYNDLPLEEAEKVAGQLTMQSRPALASRLTHTNHRNFPSAYLMTTLDRALPPKMQAMMAESVGSTVTKMKAGHTPFASEDGAKEVGKWIRKAVIGEALSKL
ncbi:MAG: hypothetical protein Q9217_005775 [Psora testacea]